MDNLSITSTNSTPEISFDAEKGELSLKGCSTIEYPFDFYETLMVWVDTYADNPQDTTKVLISLEYCNTASSKCLLNLLKKVVAMGKDGGQLTFIWEYDEEDEDALDQGKDFSRLLKVPFEYKAI